MALYIHVFLFSSIIAAFVKVFQVHQENMSVKYIPLHTPFLHSKTGVYRGIPCFFLFLLQNIDSGYSLEQPRRGLLTCTHNQRFA